MLRGGRCRDAAEEWDRRHTQHQQVSASWSADLVAAFRSHALQLILGVHARLRPQDLTDFDLLDLYEVYRRIADRH
ncbi:hypothetical protein AWC11_07650 [Mycobacterium interjectum]|nr:hypothetical protein AWC11_07650 [Mycobacterium interjectum]